MKAYGIKAVTKKLRLKGICVWLVAVVYILCIGCSGDKEAVVENDAVIDAGTVDSGVVAENNRFILTWDDERKCILLTDKSSGKIWSTIPYEYYRQEEVDAKARVSVESPLTIEYIDPEDSSIKSNRGYTGVIRNGSVYSTKIDNGIEVYYSYDKLGIVVPVTYTIDDEGLTIGIDPEKLVEGEFQLYRISVAQYLGAVKNGNGNSYLFVPSGSGALMYTDERSTGPRAFSGEVFGDEPSRRVIESLTNIEPIRLPVFGVKDGDNALAGVIVEGAEACFIEAGAGDDKAGYSSVYATYCVRGYDSIEAKVTWTQTEAKVFSKDIAKNSRLRVKYYPLSGDEANYSGMARLYSSLLFKDGPPESTALESALNLKILGGAMVKKFALGVPYFTVMPTTTFTQAREMARELKEATGEIPVLQLFGFGKSGMDIGKVAAGFGFSRKLGSERERKELEAYCSENNIPVYTDFDLVCYKSSGNGYSRIFDTAQTANLQPAYQYYLSIALRDVDEDFNRYRLLKRKKLLQAAGDLLKLVEKRKLSGVSLQTLGSIAYSDYSDFRYQAKGFMGEDVANIIESFKDRGHPVAVSAANAYAAAAASCILDSPLASAKFDAFDEEIPFYQMVFKGWKPIAGTAVNLAANPRMQVLKSIESGAGLMFTLSYEYDTELVNTPHTEFYGTKYSDNFDFIVNTVKECKAYYDAIKDAKIIGHRKLQPGVSETVFDNGVTVWVNYSARAVELQTGTIPAWGFKYISEGGDR